MRCGWPSVHAVSTSSNRSLITRSIAFAFSKCPRNRAMILRKGSTNDRI